jgi:hypothetical protein
VSKVQQRYKRAQPPRLTKRSSAADSQLATARCGGPAEYLRGPL